MQSYRPLFSLEVGHQYFADAGWRELDFQSAASSLRTFNVSGAVMRTARNRLNVYWQADRRPAMGMLADETGGELRFVMNVTAHDRSFRNFTALPRLGVDQCLYFTNTDAGAVAGGRSVRLSRQEMAAADDAHSVSELIANGLLTAGDMRQSPDFVLDIRLTLAMIDSDPPPKFSLNFATRDLFWNYFLLGGLNRENLFIVDLDERVEFEALEEEYILAERPARVFRSKTTLPVLEKSALRLQLRERGNGSGKVLVKRLPVASDNFGLQVVDGEERLVSNMFVNY